jgi:hypothetical protein
VVKEANLLAGGPGKWGPGVSPGNDSLRSFKHVTSGVGSLHLVVCIWYYDSLAAHSKFTSKWIITSRFFCIRKGLIGLCASDVYTLGIMFQRIP